MTEDRKQLSTHGNGLEGALAKSTEEHAQKNLSGPNRTFKPAHAKQDNSGVAKRGFLQPR